MSAADQQAESVDNNELLSLKVLAENRAVFARSSLFERVSSLLFEGEGELRPEIRSLVDEILVGLIGQVEVQIRQKVSERISTLTAPPLALTKMLSSDEISVARPLLERSPVFSERELLAIIAAATADHRQAIAKRHSVSAAVSTALAAKQEAKVIEALLANAGAIIPASVLEDMVALSKSMESIRKPLLLRNDLPKDLAHQMFWWVTAAMRHVILERFAVDAKELDALLASILHDTQMKRALKAAPEAQWRQGELNAILAKLRQGDVKSFTLGLAKIANITPETAARIVSDTSGEPMVLLAKSIGADRSQITSIFLQLDYKRHGKARPLAQIETIARLYDAVPADRAKATVTLWDAQIVASAA